MLRDEHKKRLWGSSTLAWKIPWMEEPGSLQSMGLLRVGQQLHFHFSLSCIGERNGNPLQCSCLENPRDGRAWWATVYGVAQSRTQLTWLSSSSSSMGFLPERLLPAEGLDRTVATRSNLSNVLPGGSDGKESICNVGDLGSIPGLGRSLEEGMVTLSSILAQRIPKDRRAWWATVYGITKSWIWLSD